MKNLDHKKAINGEVGLAFDNYKLNKARKTIRKKGYEVITEVSIGNEATVIKIKAFPKDYKRIAKMMKELDLYFKSAN